MQDSCMGYRQLRAMMRQSQCKIGKMSDMVAEVILLFTSW